MEDAFNQPLSARKVINAFKESNMAVVNLVSGFLNAWKLLRANIS